MQSEIETFYGMADTAADALRIFEMCRQGRLGRVRRRLHERERKLIRSGSVFVFDEQESGIKRWTDGRLWSPSRILGNFLIYRELEKKIPAKLANPEVVIEDIRPVSALGIESFNNWWSMTGPPNPLYEQDLLGLIVDFTPPVIPTNAPVLQSQMKPRLLNNHKGRYIFAPGGLIKKTISASIDGHVHHLICYYSAHDFCSKDVARFDAHMHALMQETPIPMDLLLDQTFRKPEAALSFPGHVCNRRSSFSVSSQHQPNKVPIRPRRHSTYSYPPIAPALSVAAMLQPTDPQPSSQTYSELDFAFPIDATSSTFADNQNALDLYPIVATADFDMLRHKEMTLNAAMLLSSVNAVSGFPLSRTDDQILEMQCVCLPDLISMS